MTRRRILYLDEVSEIAGGANSFLQLLRAISDDSYVRYFAGPAGPLFEQATIAGVQTRAHSFTTRYRSIQLGQREIPVNPYRALLRLRDAAILYRFIRAERIELVHTNNLDSHLTGWYLHHVFRVPVIWHIRILSWPRSLYRIPWPSRIIFVSNAVQQAALGPGPYPIKAIVIPNGLDVDTFSSDPDASVSVRQEFGIPSEIPIVGTVGRLTPQKRHQILIQAAQQLKARGVAVRWLIVGGEIENLRVGQSHEETLRQLIHNFDLEQEVVLTGHRSDISRLVSSFDIFAFPAFRDANPRSVLEAMSLAKPVVASRSGGLPEMLDDGQCGILVEPDNTVALADAIAALLADSQQAQRYGTAAQAKVRTHYTISAHARRVEQVYEEVLAGSG